MKKWILTISILWFLMGTYGLCLEKSLVSEEKRIEKIASEYCLLLSMGPSTSQNSNYRVGVTSIEEYRGITIEKIETPIENNPEGINREIKWMYEVDSHDVAQKLNLRGVVSSDFIQWENQDKFILKIAQKLISIKILEQKNGLVKLKIDVIKKRGGQLACRHVQSGSNRGE